MQASFVTKEAHKGVSQCDIAFALAKMAYRNGSTDDISAYVLSLDVKGRETLVADTQVNAPCSNGSTLHAEPVLAPQTPAQHKSLDGTIFTPQSNGHLDEAQYTHIPGMHQHYMHKMRTSTAPHHWLLFVYFFLK